jgi:hypothetical protein
MLADKIAAVLKSREVQTISGNDYKPAAVLVPIQECQDGDYLVLTKRADGLPTHKGQIAFPGGSVDASDANAVAAPRCAKATKKSVFRPIVCAYSDSWIR